VEARPCPPCSLARPAVRLRGDATPPRVVVPPARVRASGRGAGITWRSCSPDGGGGGSGVFGPPGPRPPRPSSPGRRRCQATNPPSGRPGDEAPAQSRFNGLVLRRENFRPRRASPWKVCVSSSPARIRASGPLESPLTCHLHLDHLHSSGDEEAAGRGRVLRPVSHYCQQDSEDSSQHQRARAAGGDARGGAGPRRCSREARPIAQPFAWGFDRAVGTRGLRPGVSAERPRGRADRPIVPHPDPT
jgi:hypothetical protein